MNSQREGLMRMKWKHFPARCLQGSGATSNFSANEVFFLARSHDFALPYGSTDQDTGHRLVW